MPSSLPKHARELLLAQLWAEQSIIEHLTYHDSRILVVYIVVPFFLDFGYLYQYVLIMLLMYCWCMDYLSFRRLTYDEQYFI